MEHFPGTSSEQSSFDDSTMNPQDSRNQSRDDSDASGYFRPGTSPPPPPADEWNVTPIATTHLTPPRIQSSNSLYGEDIISYSRPFSSDPKLINIHSEGGGGDLLVSPSFQSPSEATTITPPSFSAPVSLSPPPLRTSISSNNNNNTSNMAAGSSNNNSNENVSFSSRNSLNRPPRAPSVTPNVRYSSSRSMGEIRGPSSSSSAILTTTTTGRHYNHHSRAASTGDASFLSALTTDSNDEPTSSSHQHQQPSSSLYSFPLYQHHNNPRHHGEWDLLQPLRDGAGAELAADVGAGGNTNVFITVEEDAVPEDLQQPILDDDEVPVTMQATTIAPSKARDGKIVAEQNLRPEMTSTSTPRRRIGSHRRAPTRIGHLYADEAENAILRGIEAELKGNDGNELNEFMFPFLNTAAGECLTPLRSPNPEDPKRTSVRETFPASLPTNETDLSRSMTSLMALRKVLADGNRTDNSLVFTTKTGESCHAGEVLTADAIVIAGAARRPSRRGGPKTSSQEKDSQVGVSATEQSAHGTEEQRADDMKELECAEHGKATKAWSYIRDAQAALERYGSPPSSNIREVIKRDARTLMREWDVFVAFLRPRKQSIVAEIMTIFRVIVPFSWAAIILYYAAGNPPVDQDHNTPSASWWILFVGVRHPLVFSFARACEFVLIRYLALSNPRLVRHLGPRAGLILLSSKGWPCVIFIYSLLAFTLLSGPRKICYHWLFWQDAVGLFNADNPAGNVTTRPLYTTVLVLFIVAGVLVSVKRWHIGFLLGRRLCHRYYSEVNQVIQMMLLVSEVALLSLAAPYGPKKDDEVTKSWNPMDPSNVSESDLGSVAAGSPQTQAYADVGRLSRIEIMSMLEEWEDPDRDGGTKRNDVTMNEILEFRQSYQLMKTEYPFSAAFGPANTRDACVRSSTVLYERLLKLQRIENTLRFDTLVSVAIRKDGSTDERKLRRLVGVFRPGRDGALTLIDFVKSIDNVYRDLRILTASIRNATALDRACESIINFGFYCVLFLLGLVILGKDVFAFLMSFSSIVVSLAFAFGPAASQWVEGALLILVRKPYDIGDRIAVSDPNQETSINGSNSWIVEKMDIFSTTVRFGLTREVATLSNGAIARSRIINLRRSDSAQVLIFLKFSVDVPYAKVKVFRNAVEHFVNERNREWIGMVGFRATRVESDLGFIEYVVVLQCRESWQQVASVLESRAAVSSFCLELQNQLGMRYAAPPLPVNIRTGGDGIDINGEMPAGPFESPVMSVRPTESMDKGSQSPTDQGSKRDQFDDAIRRITRQFETKKSK